MGIQAGPGFLSILSPAKEHKLLWCLLVPSGPSVTLASGSGTKASNGIGRGRDRRRSLPVLHKVPRGDGPGPEACFIDFVHWGSWKATGLSTVWTEGWHLRETEVQATLLQISRCLFSRPNFLPVLQPLRDSKARPRCLCSILEKGDAEMNSQGLRRVGST